MVIIKFIDINIFLHVLQKIRIQTILILFLSMSICMFLQATRWFFILKKNKMNLKFIEIQKINFLGFFFDIFIPGRVGSDYFKYKRLNQLDKQKLISSIIYTRYHFFICLLIIFLFFWLYFILLNPLFSIVITISFSYIVLSLLDIIFSNYQKYFNKKKTKSRFLNKCISLINEIIKFSTNVKKDKFFFFKIYFVALTTITTSIIMLYVVAIDLGFDNKFITFGFLTPLLEIANVLPITIHGRGVSELSMWYYLDIQNNKFENILALSSAVYFVYLFLGLFSGLCLSISNLNKLRFK